MFTLLFKVAKIALQTLSSEKDVKNLKNERKEDPDESVTECSMTGTVTRLNKWESYGLIDNSIYFSYDVVCGNEAMQIGQSVHVTAKRKSVNHGWIAISVIAQQGWNSDAGSDDVGRPRSLPEVSGVDGAVEVRSLVGMVTECQGGCGVVDGKYRFNLQDCKVLFSPVVGDVLSVRLSAAAGNTVLEWEPKSFETVDGVVTAHEIDFGIINEDVIFFFSSCDCDFPVRSGMKVSAVVVESRQQLFKRRACSLKRSSDPSSKEVFPKPCHNDHGSVSLPKQLDFGSVEVGREHELEFGVRNTSSEPVKLLGCHFQRPAKNCPFSAPTTSATGVTISSLSETVVRIRFFPHSVGSDEALLFLEFADFMVRRKVTAKAFDPFQNLLDPTAPFAPKRIHSGKTSRAREDAMVIPGEKIKFPRANFKGHQPTYAVPPSLKGLVKGNRRYDIVSELPVLSEELGPANYVKKFTTLLHLEEVKMCQHMEKYDMHEAVLVRRGPFLSLNVPGLADGRPSLLVGDRSLLYSPNRAGDFVYEGFIHEVHRDDIYLKFNEVFQGSYNGETYDVSFRFGRTNFKNMHTCLRKVFKNHGSILFARQMQTRRPLVDLGDSRSSNARGSWNSSVRWLNGDLNERQKQAVCRIVEGRCRPLTYVVFGPPGTGKTVTVVEAILQVFGLCENSRILVCAPSNSATDLLAQRLLESRCIGAGDLVRVNSYQRNLDSVPEFVKPYCVDKDKLDEAIKCPIVVTTCTTAGALSQLELPQGFFTHVFVDEAGQLMEPEVMIPISLVSGNRDGCIVMAGDPKQLGPVLLSDVAKEHGLGLSFLERLLDSDLYARSGALPRTSGFDPLLVTMLVDSYRAHPSIIKFASDAFYFSEVRPVGNRDGLLDLPLLPKKGFPVVFHGVRGTEEREENSPSWFNSAEVVEAVKYLRELYTHGLEPSDVGIISPYRKQVEKIRVLLGAFGVEPCKIGSVEEFQGQERRAVIISAVRSSESFFEHDVLYNLGFLSNPKRFNVAITRAQELLVVIGNPMVLRQDPVFADFIKFCLLNGGYTGCDLPAK